MNSINYGALNYIDYYNDAKKQGLKSFSQNSKKEFNGYLPYFTSYNSSHNILSEKKLGIKEVPLKKIIGTLSENRSKSFSNNFMPIQPLDSEFARKWIGVCEYSSTVGISDPIKVYEFLNKYYVIEGNKRVSVLKYLKAHSILSDIIRILPEYDSNNDEVILYYKFLDFNKITGITSAYFSKKENFDILLYFLTDKYFNKKNPEYIMDENPYPNFERYILNPFLQICYTNLDIYEIEACDIFIEYIKIYGIPNSIIDSELREIIKTLKEELNNKDDQSVFIQDQPLQRKNNFMNTISNLVSKKKLKIAFIYSNTILKSGWTFGHELGRKYIDEFFSDTVDTTYFENICFDDDLCYDELSKIAEKHFDVIFTTSPAYMKATLRCSLKYNDTIFFNCSGNEPYLNLTTYLGKTYETKFLTGIIAGSLTKNNSIGFISSSKDSNSLSCINSYFLGARMVNPYVNVKVSLTEGWHNSNKYKESSEALIKNNCDIIDNNPILITHPINKKYGSYSMLCSISDSYLKKDLYLASTYWNWTIFYKKIITSVIDGTYDKFIKTKGSINFFFGLDSDVIGIDISHSNVPNSTKQLVSILTDQFKNCMFTPFVGPLYNKESELILEKEITLTNSDVLNMNYILNEIEII